MEDTALRSDDDLELLRFPIGRFQAREGLPAEDRDALIREIEGLPGALEDLVADLSPEQLDTPYRPGGWTVRQVVHHLADSHLNSYVRFKWAVTEDEPRIKAYDEAAWAELPDGRSGEVEVSLDLLRALHRRWVSFLRSLEPEAFGRAFEHPESGRVLLEANLQLYAWHGRHHLAHIANLRERMGW